MEFNIKEWIDKRIASLEKEVPLTDVEGIKVNKHRINELEILKLAVDKWEAEQKEDLCENCQGTGFEVCNNPDHGFFMDADSELQRLGCPVCGHDKLHRCKDKQGKFIPCLDCSKKIKEV